MFYLWPSIEQTNLKKLMFFQSKGTVTRREDPWGLNVETASMILAEKPDPCHEKTQSQRNWAFENLNPVVKKP